MGLLQVLHLLREQVNAAGWTLVPPLPWRRSLCSYLFSLCPFPHPRHQHHCWILVCLQLDMCLCKRQVHILCRPLPNTVLHPLTPFSLLRSTRLVKGISIIRKMRSWICLRRSKVLIAHAVTMHPPQLWLCWKWQNRMSFPWTNFYNPLKLLKLPNDPHAASTSLPAKYVISLGLKVDTAVHSGTHCFQRSQSCSSVVMSSLSCSYQPLDNPGCFPGDSSGMVCAECLASTLIVWGTSLWVTLIVTHLSQGIVTLCLSTPSFGTSDDANVHVTQCLYILQYLIRD